MALDLFWKFSGNALDSSGNGNDGTVNNATLTNDRFNNSNSAYNFDGTGDYINSGSLGSFTTNGSIVFNFKINTFTHNSGVFSTNVNGNTNAIRFEIWDSAGIRKGIVYSGDTGSTNSFDVLTIKETDKWYQCVITWDSTEDELKMYIDNSLILNTANSVWPTLLTNFGVGKGDSSSNWFNGDIDEVRLYDSVLTASQVEHLYNRTNFQNLYFYVEIEKLSGSWNNIGGASTTDHFAFSTLQNNSYYGTSDRNILSNSDLIIGGISEEFQNNPWEQGLSKINDCTFSISNLELLYHQIAESNSDNLYLFYGQKIRVWMCNGFVPGLIHTVPGSPMLDFDGGNSTLNSASDYTVIDKAKLLFEGLIENINLSYNRTEFTCLSNSKKRDVLIGDLVNVDVQDKNKGNIYPIVYGDWTGEKDLAPLVLDKEQRFIPKALLGNQKNEQFDNLKVWDKETEKSYIAENDKEENADLNVISFNEQTPVDTLPVDTPASSKYFKLGSIQDTLVPDLPSNSGKQTIMNINDELVGIHGKTNGVGRYDSTDNKIYLDTLQHSRGWGDSEIQTHSSGDDILKMDDEIIQANAKINLSLKLNGLIQGDTVQIFVWETASDTFTDPTGTSYKAGGNVWNAIKNFTDQATTIDNPPKWGAYPDRPDLQTGISVPATKTAEQLNYLIPLKWENTGIRGTVISCTVKIASEMDTHQITVTGGGRDSNPRANAILCYVDNVESIEDSFSNTPDNLYVKLASTIENGLTGSDDTTLSTTFSSTQTSASFQTIDGTVVYFDTPAKIAAAIGSLDNLYNNDPIKIQLWMHSEWRDSLTFKEVFYNLFAARLDLVVLAEVDSKLWFWNGKGRENSSNVYIEDPVEAWKDLLERELEYNISDINITSTNKGNWKIAASIYGKKKKYRDIIRQLCFEFGVLNYTDPDGSENLIDMIEKTNADLEITKSMILLNNNMYGITYSFQDRSDIYDRFEINYAVLTPTGDFTKSMFIASDGNSGTQETFEYITQAKDITLTRLCQTAQTILGMSGDEHNTKVINLNMIRDKATAERAMEHHVIWNTTTKAIVNINGTYDAFANLNLGSQVTLGANIDGIPQRLKDVQYIVIGKTVVPTVQGSSDFGIKLKLIEIPAQSPL